MSVSFDPNLLLSFYQSKLTTSTLLSASQASGGAVASTANPLSGPNSATANDVTPWSILPPAQQTMDAKVLGTTNFLDTSKVPVLTPSTVDGKTEQDNQKLFSLYTAVNTLAYIAKMGQRDGMTSGQLAGLNTRFQAGLQQVQNYVASTTFNNFKLQAANPTASVTSTATVPFGSFDYQTKTLVSGANIGNALPGVSSTDSFTVAIKKGGTTTNVNIDLSKISGPLTLDNIVIYTNQQLSAAGFSTRFQKVMTSGTIDLPAKATYGLQIAPGGVEQVSLSSASATPSLYIAGNTGNANAVTTTTTNAGGTTSTTAAADQQGRLIKLSGLGGSPTSSFSVNTSPTTKGSTSTAASTVVDAQGNVYTLGSTNGSFGNQINQGTQDAVLTKYDSAGNVLWTRMLGATGTATGTTLALDPTGGVVIAGSDNAPLTTASVNNGNVDTFVAKYDAQGNQTWIKQIQTLSQNQATSVSVDSTGNVFVGGQVSGGVIGSGQTSAGGQDAYVAQLDKKGNVVYEKQFGTPGSDTVSATATASDGSLYVASVQNGHAIISKYANGDARSTPVWTKDLGDLQAGGSIGGLTVSGSNVYVSGTTQNGSLTAGGQATIANASSGGADAFVFAIGDKGSSATANFVSYVGTGGQEKAGGVTVGPDGTIYLTGSTTGTFAGATRTVQNVPNMFVTAMNASGHATWTKQYGGLDGVSTGASVAVDTSGSSVLDALGLPRGTVNPNQTVDLEANTTLRAGDSFQIQFTGTQSRTATIHIDPGETLQSLATKINIQLQTAGAASVNYTGAGSSLKIAVNPGVTLSLLAGPAGFNALARLGLPAGTLTAPAVAGQTTLSTSTGNSITNQALPAYGLGLTGSFDLSTKTGADLARSQLLGVLSSIQTAYQKTNSPTQPAATVGNTSGTVSPYLQQQSASYSLALNMLSASSTTTGGGDTSIAGAILSTIA
ncbi:MAG: hypothetical protein ISS15_11665 [Alphaproteobacteria bacterium]|nr:hypothetical protein [Alphaproteobacteria bacterium]MBL7098309.1 hypothetical protein [Alphaproteobacteria bacterium]